MLDLHRNPWVEKKWDEHPKCLSRNIWGENRAFFEPHVEHGSFSRVIIAEKLAKLTNYLRIGYNCPLETYKLKYKQLFGY